MQGTRFELGFTGKIKCFSPVEKIPKKMVRADL